MEALLHRVQLNPGKGCTLENGRLLEVLELSLAVVEVGEERLLKVGEQNLLSFCLIFSLF